MLELPPSVRLDIVRAGKATTARRGLTQQVAIQVREIPGLETTEVGGLKQGKIQVQVENTIVAILNLAIEGRIHIEVVSTRIDPRRMIIALGEQGLDRVAEVMVTQVDHQREWIDPVTVIHAKGRDRHAQVYLEDRKNISVQTLTTQVGSLLDRQTYSGDLCAVITA